MAIDEFQNSRIGTVTTFLNDSRTRWSATLVASLQPGFTFANLFATVQAQWAANWGLMNDLVPFAGHPVMATIVIHGVANVLAGMTGETMVGRKLSGFVPQDFSASAMQDFTGANTIVHLPPNAANPNGIPPFSAVVTGTFEGEVQVRMEQNAPAAGIYRGILFVAPPGAVGPEPLAWVVVIAS